MTSHGLQEETFIHTRMISSSYSPRHVSLLMMAVNSILSRIQPVISDTDHLHATKPNHSAFSLWAFPRPSSCPPDPLPPPPTFSRHDVLQVSPFHHMTKICRLSSLDIQLHLRQHPALHVNTSRPRHLHPTFICP